VTKVQRPVESLRVKHFKAVKDSGTLKLDGFTVFIGDNGTGKSSILEALRFVRDLSRDTLDRALDPFGGFEHLRWKGGPAEVTPLLNAASRRSSYGREPEVFVDRGAALRIGDAAQGRSVVLNPKGMTKPCRRQRVMSSPCDETVQKAACDVFSLCRHVAHAPLARRSLRILKPEGASACVCTGRSVPKGCARSFSCGRAGVEACRARFSQGRGVPHGRLRSLSMRKTRLQRGWDAFCHREKRIPLVRAIQQ